MLIQAPIYYEQNNTHFVNIYEETEDGTFRRTQSEPLRQLRNNIKGISRTQGELVSAMYDRQERRWSSATVSFHYGRPQSFYYFIRDMVAKNKFYVFSKPQLSGHLIKFDVHELVLKPGTSQRHFSLLKEKYVEAINLWDEQTLVAQRKQSKATSLAKAAAAPVADSLDVDFESAKTMIILPHQRQAAGLSALASNNDAASRSKARQQGGHEAAANTQSVEKATPSEKRTLKTGGKSSSGFLRRFIFTID